MVSLSSQRVLKPCLCVGIAGNAKEARHTAGLNNRVSGTVTLDKAVNGRGRFFACGHDLESTISVVVVHLHEVGYSSHAGASPSGPDLQHDYFATEVAEAPLPLRHVPGLSKRHFGSNIPDLDGSQRRSKHHQKYGESQHEASRAG